MQQAEVKASADRKPMLNRLNLRPADFLAANFGRKLKSSRPARERLECVRFIAAFSRNVSGRVPTAQAAGAQRLSESGDESRAVQALRALESGLSVPGLATCLVGEIGEGIGLN